MNIYQGKYLWMCGEMEAIVVAESEEQAKELFRTFFRYNGDHAPSLTSITIIKIGETTAVTHAATVLLGRDYSE